MKLNGMFERSADTCIIENKLRSTAIGDFVSYAELSTLIGRDVREFGKSSIRTARATLIGESIFFAAVPNEGLKRLSNEEALSFSRSFVRKAHSAATRGMDHLSHVPFDQLSEQSKRNHLATSAQLGAIQLFGKSSSFKKIEGRVNGTDTPVPLGETLKLFGG